MTIVIQIIGILMIAMGLIAIIKPTILKTLIEVLNVGKRIYFIGVLRIIIAILFLLGASGCKIPQIIIAIAILILLSGLLIFAIKLEKIKAILTWWQNKSPIVVRLAALIALAFGAIIIYAA